MVGIGDIAIFVTEIKRMKRLKINMLMLVVASIGMIAITSCKKDDEIVNNGGDELPEDILILNNWIWDGMNEVYLWEAYIPDLDPTKEPDPEAFFYKLLYEDDHNSWITDDYDALVAMFSGVETATGMSAYPMIYEGNQVVSFVEYVTPDSPAANAGIARGDIIYTIDGTLLTRFNYYTLYYQNTATFGFADWNGTEMVPNGTEITLTAIELNQNPIVYDAVIDYEGEKIGYFVYTQFTGGPAGEWLDSLNNVFEGFRSAGVSDVIVDLRYNPGGSLDLSAYIAATLGPVTPMQENDVFVRLVWNDLYNNYWAGADLDDDGKPDGANSSQLLIPFPHSDLNLNLSTVYFLTTDRTASACESLITGLDPYMDVVQVGDTTYGKCYASVTIDDWEVPKRHNWAMQPIVIKYSNAVGFTDFVDGLIPDFQVNDNLLYAKPFGSLEDPLLAKALEEITGIAPGGLKSAEDMTRLRSIPVPRKPVEEWHVDLPIRIK